MASYTVTTSTHPTLTGTTADQVTVGDAAGGHRFRYAEVSNRHASNPLYFTMNQGSSTPTTAVGAANGTWFVAPNSSLALPIAASVFVVSVVGDGNPYSVQGI